MVEPIPDAQWGIANWQDYVNNWRDADAEWLMARTILRFQTNAERDAKLPSPGLGQVIFNADPSSGTLEIRGPASWVPYKPMPVYLVKGADSASQVLISHLSADGKGVSFTPTNVNITANFTVLGGVLGADPTGVTVKTGGHPAKLSTDASNLVSDSPIKAPSIISDGALSAGAVTASSITVSGTSTLAGVTLSGTITGGTISPTTVVNGASGTIGGVKLGTTDIGGANIVSASEGIQSQLGMFYGDSTGAYLRQRAANKGGLGPAHVKVTDTTVALEGTVTQVNNQLQVRGGRSIAWYNAAGTQLGNSGVVVYDTNVNLPAANYPEGTIWFS